MLHFYYDRQEQDQESYKYNTKTKYLIIKRGLMSAEPMAIEFNSLLYRRLTDGLGRYHKT